MKKQYLLFDLDGTITDPKIGITKSVQYSLRALGITADNPDDFVPFIGPPLRDSYKNLCNFSDEETEIATAKYREYFSKHGIFENTLYPGITELLKELFLSKRTLVVATSKPTVYATEILRYFDIDRYFAFVAGSELDGSRSRKDLVIKYALENAKIASVNDAIMIGDREHDVIGAKKLGMDAVGVLYGYGSRDELLNAHADYIVETVPELLSLLRDI